jgi:carboxylesterase
MLNDFRADIKIICSIDDDVVAPTTIDWISKTVTSSTCKIIWLGGSYHIITLDNEREIVVNESVEFIQETFFKRKAIVEYSKDAKELIIRDRIIE